MVRANKSFPLVTTLFVALVILFPILYLRAPRITLVESPQTSTHYLADGTEGLTKQAALHLSKMTGGGSVGGFPKFEPPDDDPKYRSKIKSRSYSGQDANGWVKEINNFLKQIVERNSNMTLEEILQRQRLTPTQIDNFMDALRQAEVAARGMQGYGVTEETASTLQMIMKSLGVIPWP